MRSLVGMVFDDHEYLRMLKAKKKASDKILEEVSVILKSKCFRIMDTHVLVGLLYIQTSNTWENLGC